MSCGEEVLLTVAVIAGATTPTLFARRWFLPYLSKEETNGL